jgi:hypothetical protein
MATGLSEEQAKTDLCRAMADQKIGVRVRVATTTGHYLRGKIFSNGNVCVPPHLSVSEFDWVGSRPLTRWLIGPRLGEHYAWLSGWESQPLDLVELWTAGVIEVLGGKEGEKNTTRNLADRGQRRTSLAARLAEELKVLYPQGRPVKANEVIRRELEARGTVGKLSPRTLERALALAWTKGTTSAG